MFDIHDAHHAASTWPLLLPVPKAKRVTRIPDLPRVTRSVAVRGAACTERLPTLPSAPTAIEALRNSRRESGLMRDS
jgi:hypothetical protein